LPGPWRFVEPGAPFFCATWPAVCPLPYCLVLLDCASALVSCAVEFPGFTPALEVVVVVCAVVVVVAAVVAVDAVCGAGGSSFFCWPGAFAEFPGEESAALPPFPLPFPLPFPFPAYAEPANARTLRTSTHVPVIRIVILPFPHVSR